MAETCDVRRRIVSSLLAQDAPVNDDDVSSLSQASETLKSSLASGYSAELKIDGKGSIRVDLNYEIIELEKDLVFLDKGDDALYEYCAGLNRSLKGQVSAGIEKLGSIEFRNFISDRDGTINNYCGRYLTSVQSCYNALFLTRFAKQRVDNSLILTSAPLDKGGLVDVSTAPGNVFIYAGSKGREYLDASGRRGSFEIPKGQREKISMLNERLVELLKRPEYEKFAYIGSGLQRKFGQTTIARQDISGSIEKPESEMFLDKIEALVLEIDPSQEIFRIEDTGLDIEIILTIKDVSGSGELKDFDKRDAVLYLDKQLGLGLAEGPNLVCGDTMSDVPMARACMEQSGDTWAVFVSREDKLRSAVMNICPQSYFVDSPDILVILLHELSKISQSVRQGE